MSYKDEIRARPFVSL